MTNLWGEPPECHGPGPHGIEQLVARDMADRQRQGIAKYGVSVADNELTRSEWLQHAYEEALDLAVYLKRLIEFERKVRDTR